MKTHEQKRVVYWMFCNSYTFNLLFIRCCIYNEKSVVCMFQLYNFMKKKFVLKFRKDGTAGGRACRRRSFSFKEAEGARERGGTQAQEGVHCVSRASAISHVQN